MKEEILREAFDDFRFADYPYNDSLTATLQAMEKYAEEVLKIAAEKATMALEESSDDPYDHYAIVDKNSILNCLKQ